MTAIFPGSFDPPTLGHEDLIKRGVRLFDEVVVAVLYNPVKSPLFTVQERVSLLKEITEDIPGAQVEFYSGLLTEFAKTKSAEYILRGVRNETDCAYEIPMAQANKGMHNRLETVIFATDPVYGYMSSGLIREIAAAGYSCGFDDKLLDQWVSPAVKEKLKSKFV